MSAATELAVPSVAQLLEEQDGVISRVQARAAGMTEDAWQWRLDTGRLTSVLPGIAVRGSSPPTDRQRSWAAVLRGGAGAHLTADAALLVLGVKLPAPDVLHVVATGQRSPKRTTDGQVLVRCHRVEQWRTWAHPARQPPVLRAAPAVLHAFAWAPSDRAAEWRLTATVQQRAVRIPDLRTALDQMPRLPRRGLLRTVLDDVELGAHARSELDFLRFLRRHQLPPPDRLQRPVRTGVQRYLDAWWERQRVAVEVDGVHHRAVGAWDDDALRANDVQLAERHDRILLLRFTSGALRHDGDRSAAQLRAALA